MLNKEKLSEAISAYKEYFPEHWQDEKYKWEAVQHFQKHWDINASDFQSMFLEATEKTANLLASINNFPRGMIKQFAIADQEATRSMFINLFDESQDLEARIENFQTSAEQMRLKYGKDTWKQHYQEVSAITTYLWLRYPDKYYIYRYSIFRTVSKELECDFIPKKGNTGFNLSGGYQMYDEICKELTVAHLSDLLDRYTDDECYEDSYLKTMTIDFGYFISKFWSTKNTAESEKWWPEDYEPGLTTEDWLDLLQDEQIFTTPSLEVIKRFKDYGGMATCTQLAIKYGENKSFYIANSVGLAKRVAKRTNCALMPEDRKNFRWWPILYIGKDADKEDEGSFIWKIREELAEALEQIDLSDISLYASPVNDTAEIHYWWLNANPSIWHFSEIEIGETQSYTLYNENGNKRRIFQNFLDAKAGDLVIGYESYPVKQVVALAKITQAQDGENLYFEKTEGLATPVDYLALKSFPELEKMEYFTNPQGSLFKLTKGEYNFIMDYIRESNPVAGKEKTIEQYTKEQFLEEVYLLEDKFDILLGLLKNKKNLILQGAPGVGKTFTAKRLAYAMMGEKDDSRIEFVQFHQSYSYEDFIMGYKPDGNGFKLTNGIFYQFCQEAANHPEKDYFFIIDEINRGNLSKIFGELLMLIEKDYRGTKATLAYSGTTFSVPKNLYIIGMMNTADRSLAMIDYALRRRFSFFEMEPGFTSKGFKKYQASLENEIFDSLITQVVNLNKEIATDPSLGKGFRIGHSYFCGQKECSEEWMKSVVFYDIIPMLEEYWFDEPENVQRWENRLSGVFND